MRKHKWKSKKLYQHPAKHQAGTHGYVTLSEADVYALQVGRGFVPCPQVWASKIHAEETQGDDSTMDDIAFKKGMLDADKISDPDRKAGFIFGLRRAYHGDSFASHEEIDKYESLSESDDKKKQQRYKGYQAGLSYHKAKKTKIWMYITHTKKAEWVGHAQARGMTLTDYVTMAVDAFE